ncbi:MAG: MBL fold metallo-hydrolase [Thermoplasmata archaeon]
MTKLSFFGGINEIGGNKFLLEDRDNRVFLDFGKNFAREKRYFDEPWIRPRTEDHLLVLGILPNLPGLYKGDEERKASVDAVLISHPHTDHYDSIRWLKDEIPAYSTTTAQAIFLAREFSGRAGPSMDYAIASMTKTKGSEILRPLETLAPGKPTQVAGMSTTAFDVDHSVPGSVGYVVETEAGNIAYTGDFRLHGPRASQSRAFLQAAAEHEPEALLIEGTHVDESKIESEKEVQEKVTRVVEATQGLVVAGFAIADMDRLATFHAVARATDRTLVMTAKQAFMADQLIDAGHPIGFDLKGKNVLIFRKEKKRSSAFEDHLQERYGERFVAASDIRGIQERAILVASLMDMLALPAIDPVPGSVYILSSSEPFDEEMEISYEKLLGWLAYYGLPLFQVHASGHATAHDLRAAIETIQPKKVFLVHTTSPALYARFLEKLGHKVVQPREGKEYTL